MENGFASNRFIRLYVPGQQPTLNDIKRGEITLNVPDGTLYIRAAQPDGIDIVKSIGNDYSPVTTIDYVNLFFYGSSPDSLLSAVGIQGLYQCVETETSIIVNTGTTNQTFYVAIPSIKNVTSVVDLDCLNAEISNQYVISSINITNRVGSSVSYKLYKMSTGIPYLSNHRHQVSIS